MTHGTAYDAVMRGMGGDMIAADEYGKYNYYQLLDAIRVLGIIERGETRYYSVGTMVGMISHNCDVDAISWARGTHISQRPNAFKVTRTKRGWKVESIY